MKIAALFLLSLVFFSTKIFACDSEPTMATTGKVLKQLVIEKSRFAAIGENVELGLSIKASVKGASWQKTGAEAAVLTVFVDDKYNQDAILFAGAETFEYQMLLGKFAAGAHRITIVFNRKHSAPNASAVKIHSASAAVYEDLLITKPDDRSIPAYLATINAPLIYLRPDTIDKFSDVPLLTYYEIFDEPENVKRIRYTTIFTNEDGGTQSAALLARWGRLTDIEWINEIRVTEKGEILSEIYQGANHETRGFAGARFGNHPLYFDATVNNNFSDAGCSPLRVSPRLIEANLSSGARETVMDANFWTYRIMAQEAVREGRINPQALGANSVDDPRRYLYAEVYSENDAAAIAVEIQTADGKTSRSDWGDARLRVDRSGYKRIAVRLPSTTSPLKSINLLCQPTARAEDGSGCRNARLVKFVRLDEKYRPVVTKNPKNESLSLRPNEKLTWLPAN